MRMIKGKWRTVNEAGRRMTNDELWIMNDWSVLSCMGGVERRGWRLGVRARTVP